MAVAEAAPPPKKGPSLLVQGAVVLVLTLAALGGGWFAGDRLSAELQNSGGSEPAAASHATPAAGHGDAQGGTAEDAPANPLLVSLAPMTTNLAAPDTVWVQMELALLLDQPQPPEMIETIHQDLFAYLRTVKLHQIEGASGYRHLKGDLEERARIRSDGHVKQVLIRVLIFE